VRGGALDEADAVVCNRLTPADTEGAGRLRLVQAVSAGADSIDQDALPPGCALCNVHVFSAAIAEWVVMTMLALVRRLVVYDRDLRRGEWHSFAPDALPSEQELAGRTLGTIGYGHIGVRVAELGRAVGMDTIAVTRSPSPERARGVGRLEGLDGLDRLLREADFAVVCVPGGAQTRGLIGARELRLLGADGYLVNVGRGAVVEERALYEALRDSVIAGAGIDVWYRYPNGPGEAVLPSAFPFHELDNVVMTPHVSGRSEETDERLRRFLVEQLRRFARDEPLENVIAVGDPR
jgi:phosphoglycerate dehydrogenase-like enzyme